MADEAQIPSGDGTASRTANGMPTIPLPPLREDLELIPAGVSTDGAPIYTIHDPITGKFFRIGWMEFEFLSRWHLGTLDKLMVDLAQHPSLHMPLGEVFNLIQFLKGNQLTAASTPEDTGRLLEMAQKRETGWFDWLLHNYLYLKVPLLRPDRLLVRMLDVLNPLFGKLGLMVFVGLLTLAITVVVQEWATWRAEFSILKTPEGLALAFLTLTFSKIVHEFGHGLMARHFGCRVPRMGVAIILLWPVLWTDTTQAWRLHNPRQKLLIDSAGILFELTLAAIATLLWAIAPDGVLRSALHILSGVAWIMTLSMNVSPFMRFDGYYILSDLVDTPNLQTRSFALTRWWLRRVLLGIDDAPPEVFSPKRQNFMIGYAIMCWLYRLVLFAGIALMVYNHFFKALGILLFAIEIWWFMLKPVVTELRHWFATLQKSENIPVQSRRTAAIVFFIVLLFALPIHRSIQAPGILRADTEYLIQTPIESRVGELHIKNGQRVSKDAVLMTLISPDLDIALNKTREEVTSLRQQIAGMSAGDATFRRAQLLQDMLAKKLFEQQALQSVADNLIIKAPNDGIIRDLDQQIAPGLWLQKREPLFLIASDQIRVDVFVTEEQLGRLAIGQSVSLLEDSSTIDTGDFVIDRIEQSPVDSLPYEELASTHQGPIRVRQEPGMDQRRGPVPADQLFRVILKPKDDGKAVLLDRSGPVIVSIKGHFYSPLLAFIKRATGVLIRESNL